MEAFNVKIRESFLSNHDNSWILKLGAKADEEYPVLGAVGDKLLLKIGENLADIYPRHLVFCKYL
jgi:hypothetical protein